jgi:glycine cleavage system H protein
MSEFLELIVDKFIFRIATDCLYTDEGLWARQEEDQVRVGLSDFVQQRSGDVAFVEVKPAGSVLNANDELIVLETIKVNTSFGSPVSGKILSTNAKLLSNPEVINQDPYGEGWIALLETTHWTEDAAQMLTPQGYYTLAKKLAEQEL